MSAPNIGIKRRLALSVLKSPRTPTAPAAAYAWRSTRGLSTSAAKKGCCAQGVLLDRNGFPEARRKTRSFLIPSDARPRLVLVVKHLEEFRSEGKTLVWFDDWPVWPSGQRMHILERFLSSYWEHRPLIQVPAFLFSQDKYEVLVSFVTLGSLLLWDIHVVGRKARRLLFRSHDEVTRVAA